MLGPDVLGLSEVVSRSVFKKMIQLLRQITKNRTLSTLSLILVAIVLQYGPIAIEPLVSQTLNFERGTSFEWEGDVSDLRPGDYYVSVGRPHGSCELTYNSRILSSTKGELTNIRPQLLLGAGLKIISHAPGEKLIVKVSCEKQQGFTAMLHHRPIVAKFFPGLFLQTIRIFVDLVMGPLASLLLLLSILLNPPRFSEDLNLGKPFVVFGVISLLYSASLSQFGSLFLSGANFTIFHIMLRSLMAGAFVYLCSKYSRPRRGLILALMISAGLAFGVGYFAIDMLQPYYSIQYFIYPLSSLIVTIDLIKANQRSRVAQTLISLSLAWTALQCIDLINMRFLSAPFIGPSFIAIIAVTITIIRYQELISLEISAFEAISNAKSAAEIADLSAKIAHDVRSPLALLKVLSRDDSMPGDLRGLIISASDRIRGIADTLLEKNRHLASSGSKSVEVFSPKVVELSDVVKPIWNVINEKKLLTKTVNIRFDHGMNDQLLARIESVEFSRVISNLFDNAIEAMNAKGTIDVSLILRSEDVVICIKDSGSGVPTELLPRLFEYGASFGKSNGNGLGLYNAKATIEAWGGHIQIQSVTGSGAEVLITLTCV
jgi:signal transduction histidine kinase